MIAENSRYAGVEHAELATPAGPIRYLRRRFLPQGAALPLLAETQAGAGERLDLIAARLLGDPEQSWRICDANNAMRPTDLLAEPGRTLRVPLPEA